jgi:hypothetical protein
MLRAVSETAVATMSSSLAASGSARHSATSRST